MVHSIEKSTKMLIAFTSWVNFRCIGASQAMQPQQKRSILDCGAYETLHMRFSLMNRYRQNFIIDAHTKHPQHAFTGLIRGCKLKKMKKKTKQFNDPTPTTAKQSICRVFLSFFLFAWMWIVNKQQFTWYKCIVVFSWCLASSTGMEENTMTLISFIR